MSFQDDFKKYCKVVQPNVVRLVLTFVLSMGFLSYTEFAYFRGTTDVLQVIGCGRYDDQNSWASDYSTTSIDTCVEANMSQCISSQYSTESNSTLQFNIPFLGVPEDKNSKVLGVVVALSYIGVQGLLQSFAYLSTLKRNRIQNLLGQSMVYILCNKRTVENRRTLLFLFTCVFYTAVKVLFIINRQDYYSRIECSDIKYHLSFTLTPGTWIGTVALTSIIFVFMTLQLFVGSINYLGDMDLRNLLINFKSTSLTQLADITAFPIESFDRLISKQVDINYLHLSFFPRYIKKCVFFLPSWSISDDEIVKYILHYKSQNPNAFYPYNVLLSDIGKIGTDDNQYDRENGRLL